MAPASDPAPGQGRNRLGQARSGRVLRSPRSEDALRQVPDRRDAPSTAKSNLPTPLCTSLYPGSATHRRSRGAAGRNGGGARCGETGRSPSGGHPANRHSSRVHFKASRREPWRGRGGELDGPPQCLLGDVVHARGTKPQRTQRELQVRERSARIPGRHAPKLGSIPPPPCKSCAGRPRRGGCRARAGGGCGAAGVAGFRDSR